MRSWLSAITLLQVTSAANVTPLQKVVEMMNDMLAKGKAAKQAERVEFAKYTEWCQNTIAETTKALDEEAEQILQLKADIEKATTDAEGLAEEVKDLEEETSELENEVESATAVRKTEKADYKAAHADFSESIDAIARAITVLSSQGDVKQALLQVSSLRAVPAEAKRQLTTFLGIQERTLNSAPEAKAYENQSGGIVGLLEKMLQKFEDQRLALEKEEMNCKANYETLMQTLNDHIQSNEKAISSKVAAKAQKKVNAGTAKGDLSITENSQSEDTTTLSDTKAACRSASAEFEKNQNTRADELEAIAKAVDILSSDAVSGAADNHLPSLLQSHKSDKVLAQLRSVVNGDADKVRNAAAYLQAQAAKTGSRYLSVMAAHLTADPFAKVKKMIKDLLTKLMEEANSEADHKGYCDAEMATNKQTRENKAAEVDGLTQHIDQLTSETAQLTEEVALLSDSIAEIKQQQSEATGLRNEEREKNENTIVEAKSAQAAVEKATQVLKDFYAQQDGAFLQGKSKAKTHSNTHNMEPYKGMEGGGVMSFLEVILSDFARLESETSTAEDTQAAEYEKFMDESNDDAAVKNTEMTHKVSKKQVNEETIRNLQKELGLTQDELDKALTYYDKLKPDCVETGMSYEDKKRMREEEIQSLKEALTLLSE